MKALYAALALSATAFGAHAGTFDTFTRNGSAVTLDSGNTLRLTNDFAQAGSAWSASKVSLASDFSVAFSFKLADGTAADGITITLQNSAAGAAALGNTGGYLGYQGIDKSVAFICDTFENGFDTDRTPGENTSVTALGNLVDFWGGATVGQAYSLRNRVLYSWVDYSVVNQQFLMYISDTNVKPGAAQENISTGSWAGLLGSNDLYVGFTGGTGAAFDNQDILSFSVSAQAVPEPHTYGLMLAGLSALAFVARRRRLPA